MKLTRETRVLRMAAYGAFVVLVAGVAFGKYYASRAPERLKAIEKSKPQAAITGYTEAIRLDPSDAELYFRRGRTHLLLGRYSDAVSDFTRALERSADDPTYLTFRGIAFLGLNDIRSAERDLEKVAAQPKHGDDPTEILALAGLDTMRDRGDDAIKEYTEALQTLSVPRYQDERCIALTERANAYVRKEQYAKALVDQDQAYDTCRSQQMRVAVLLNRGSTYYWLKQPEFALTRF